MSDELRQAAERLKTFNWGALGTDHCSDDTYVLIERIVRDWLSQPAPVTDAESPFDRQAADEMADAVAALVTRKVIDARSPAADALLNYRNPPRTERSDLISELQAENERLREACQRVLKAIDSQGQVDTRNRVDLVRDATIILSAGVNCPPYGFLIRCGPVLLNRQFLPSTRGQVRRLIAALKG